MGLFSKSGKNKQDTAGQDSGYYTSADDQAVLERARSKRASSADGPKRGRASREAADDPMLPEKKRARRRLVGAIALALTVAIVLPMVLDSEPKPLASDIDIKIPSKDKPAEAVPAPAPAPQAGLAPAAPAAAPVAAAPAAAVPAAATLDKSEEIVADPSKLGKPSAPLALKPAPEAKPSKADADAKDKLEADAKAKADAKAEADAKLAKAKVDAEAKAKLEAKAKSDAKAEAEHKVAEAKPAAAGANDDARALAILEGKPADNQKYVLQVAALAAQDKVDELQGKLKEAGIKSFTQKVPTAQGERTRIRVGPFNSKEEAEKVRAKLTKLGLNGSLVPV